MILLDTNVVSEVMKAAPNPRVEAWLGAQPMAGLFITTITEAELRLGVALLSKSRRRDNLAAMVAAMLAEDFTEHILPFDSAAAMAYAAMVVIRRQAGVPIAQVDAQIAAIAKSRGATLATRNIADFKGCGIEIINPWSE